MTTSARSEERGVVYTFYSFKGGVGRTMALANVATLLGQWGHSVLIVDWDLEAPGLERFYESLNPAIYDLRKETPGVIDLIVARATGNELAWQDCLIDIDLPGGTGSLSLLSAGRNDETYGARLSSIDFPGLFDRHGLGSYIEMLRDGWKSTYDFVLIDSRTGVTDIGGVCTVHLADVLVLLFTTNRSSAEGAKDILVRARKAQEHLPVDRLRLVAVPVPARDESRTEYDRATQWKGIFAEEFGEAFRDWLPKGVSAQEAIDHLRIPYIPYWSFGERLPVLEEGTSDRAGLGHAYQILARLLAARLDWYEALGGETLAPPPSPGKREFSVAWLERNRRAALEGLARSGLKGFMEICYLSPDSQISKSQPELLSAAKQAQIHTFGWPIGIVLENREVARPRPTDDGILAMVSVNHPFLTGRPIFDYWTLTKRCEFYTLTSFPEEDSTSEGAEIINFDTRIVRATEVLLHCANLYKIMGLEPSAHIEMNVRYGGLRGRTLSAASRQRVLFELRKNVYEDEVSIFPLTFTLATVDAEIVTLVRKLCEPLFVVFDFEQFDDVVYQQIVSDFVRGRIT